MVRGWARFSKGVHRAYQASGSRVLYGRVLYISRLVGQQDSERAFNRFLNVHLAKEEAGTVDVHMIHVGLLWLIEGFAV